MSKRVIKSQARTSLPLGEPRIGPSLPSAAWKRFAAKHWDKTPTVVRQPFGSAAPRSENVFPAVIAACDAERRGGANVRLFLERQRRGTDEAFAALVRNEYDDLPRASDASPGAYARRIARVHAPDRFCLIANDLQHYDWQLLLRMRPFLREVCEHGMLPLGGASLNFLVGDYRRTPFGVHKDQFHVFTFVLEGSKRVLLWPFEAFAGHQSVKSLAGPLNDRGANVFLRPEEFRRAAANAIELDARAGDLIYWPASYWHVVVGTGALATTVSWDLQTTPSLLAPAGPTLASGGSRAGHRIGRTRMGARGASPLPSAVDRKIRAGATEDAVMEGRRAAAVTWLRLTTGFGCTMPPDPAPFDVIQDQETIRGLSESPVAWTRTAKDHCVFSANGQSLDLAADAGTLDRVCEALAQLNRGRPIPVIALTERFSGRRRISRGAMREILRTLGSWHAIERVQ